MTRWLAALALCLPLSAAAQAVIGVVAAAESGPGVVVQVAGLLPADPPAGVIQGALSGRTEDFSGVPMGLDLASTPAQNPAAPLYVLPSGNWGARMRGGVLWTGSYVIVQMAGPTLQAGEAVLLLP